ncbi:MAG: glutamate--cysteine ligase [Buchnera aphidicola (Pentalonia nigronervosa)]|uniref:Glutamate--cysteine ligase n=1 Tax=Buchnera aphidicola (Pentalonia nigronervosa) TaxID=1309793 RepID=A0A7H1B016_9GAMM|nr:MAG: glutamate--cysteine ligase [Buchnera aphidicola (Pentalonia nigronervosa)]
MIQDISKKINWLKNNSKILDKIFRGIERETLRITKNGLFSQNSHPHSIGSALTHKWITTDFAENLLEFITPVSNNIDYLLTFLEELHVFSASKNNNELMWPLSIPYFYNSIQKIKIAKYGTSNIGMKKYIYRKGLKNRYGDLVNIISGTHYNFSLPKEFWSHEKNIKKESDYISSGYLKLIRNYYRFGWIIPYLFGASPAIPSCFLKNSKTLYHSFKRNKENMLYLPWATSLRLSDCGYTNTSIMDLDIMFNDLETYIKSFKKALTTTSKKFFNIGIKDKIGNFKQLNTNILQIENELYTQIRPKRNTHQGETLLEALNDRGIEYVEIRSLDINPFSPIGINKHQILLLDLFLIWCALVDAPKMNKNDFALTIKNWKKIILEGRKPNQKIFINSQKKTKKISEVGCKIFQDLKKIAFILDHNSNNILYQNTCKAIEPFLYNPELTYSAQLLKILLNTGIKQAGLDLAKKYHNIFLKKNRSNIYQTILNNETIRSHQEQKKIEKKDQLSLEQYLSI